MKINTYPFKLLIAAILILSACSPGPKSDDPQTREMDPSSSAPESTLPSPTTEIAAQPESTPTPALDAGWDDLPLLPTPIPLSQNPLPQIDSSEEISMLPTSTPSGRLLDLPDALWGAGFRNGLPAIVDGAYPEDEYAPTRSFASVLHMQAPAEFPAFLEPEQTLVIHLPPLPPDVYALHLFTTGDETDGERISNFPNRRLARERNLCIRWNDRRVWQRFHSPYADHTRVVLDPTLFNPEENVITVENRGEHTVPLDALRITPLRPGSQPIFVALQSGQWLPTPEALWVRTVMVWAPAPVSSESEMPEWSFPQRMAPRNIQEAQLAWTQVESRYRELEKMNHPHLPILREWIPPLRSALERGMMPIVMIEPEHSRHMRDLGASTFLFGDVVEAWNLRHRGDPYGIREQMREQINTPVFLDGRSDETPHLPDFSAIQSDVHHMRIPFLGLMLRAYFDGKTTMESLERLSDASTLLYPDANDEFKQDKWAQVGEWLYRNTLELLMCTRQQVTLTQGFPGSLYFPDGSGRPSPIWHFVRPLFRFGGVSSYPTLANIVPEQSVVLMNSSFWQVADNGKDRVEILASIPYMEGQAATLDLPLPWSGPTRVLQHQVIPEWHNTEFPKAQTIIREVEAVYIPPSASQPFQGWLRLRFDAQRLMLFELTPANSPPESIHRIQVQHPTPFIPETRRLFQVGETPPPSWWSREKLVQNQRWAWNAAGPVNLEIKTPTRPGSFPEWEPLKGFHPPIPGSAKGAMPLSETSTTLQFLENPNEKTQMVRMEMMFNIIGRSKAVGMWIRAHPAPGTKPQPMGFHNRPRTRFWIGNHEERQLIEIPYGSWCFLSGSAGFWQHDQPTGIPRQRKGVVFWPDESLEIQPILEINSFDAYQVSLKRGLETPDKTLGFIHERENGTLALLIVGLPGKGSFWRQRLTRYIDTASLAHVLDESLLISAPSPEDPPPERVPFSASGEPNTKLIEIKIPRMPQAPSEVYRKRILKDFPLIGQHLNSGELSAVLFEEIQGNEVD